jgi:GNAT superfamily N-acetyltransferase
MTSDLNLEPILVDSDDLLEAYLEIRAPLFPHRPTNLATEKEEDEAMPESSLFRRWLYRDQSGDWAGACYLACASWTGGEGQHLLGIMPRTGGHHDPLKAGIEIIVHASAEARALGSRVVRAWPLSRNPFTVEAFDEQGWSRTQEQPVSMLEPAGFDFEAWRGRVGSLEADGWTFRTVQEMIDEDAEPARRKGYELVTTLDKDIPLPYELATPSYEDYIKEEAVFGRDYPTWTLAILNGEWHGISMLFKNRIDPSLGHTGLTGVSREHRRKGIAAAMKAISIQMAKELGIRLITTENAEINPMLQLNIQLGFREAFREIGFELKLD